MRRPAARPAFVLPGFILAAFAALALTGCGFSPMLAESTGVAPQLSGVSVETAEGRSGYLIGVALRDRLGTWEGDRARYVLRTRTAETRFGTALTIDQVASRIMMRITLAYGLYDLQTGALLTQGEVLGQAGYDLPPQPYAGIRAEQDAAERAAEDAANRAVLTLARYFNDRDAGRLPGQAGSRARRADAEAAAATAP